MSNKDIGFSAAIICAACVFGSFMLVQTEKPAVNMEHTNQWATDTNRLMISVNTNFANSIAVNITNAVIRIEGFNCHVVSDGTNIVISSQPIRWNTPAPSANPSTPTYTVAMYRNDIEAVTNGTLSDRISNLAILYFEKGFDAGFTCGKSGGNETNGAMIKAWHREFIKEVNKLTP